MNTKNRKLRKLFHSVWRGEITMSCGAKLANMTLVNFRQMFNEFYKGVL